METIGIGIGLLIVISLFSIGILLYGVIGFIYELTDEFLLPPRISLDPKDPREYWLQYYKIARNLEKIGVNASYQVIQALIQNQISKKELNHVILSLETIPTPDNKGKTILTFVVTSTDDPQERFSIHVPIKVLDYKQHLHKKGGGDLSI